MYACVSAYEHIRSLHKGGCKIVASTKVHMLKSQQKVCEIQKLGRMRKIQRAPKRQIGVTEVALT